MVGESEEIKPLDGQCGNCAFAKEFGCGPVNSEDDEGVLCTSEEHALWLDTDLKGNVNTTNSRDQLKELGYIDLFRWEVMADEDFRCPQWKKKE